MVEVASLAALVATAMAIPYAYRPAWILVVALLVIWAVSARFGSKDSRGTIAQVLAAALVLGYYGFVWLTHPAEALALLPDLPESGPVLHCRWSPATG